MNGERWTDEVENIEIERNEISNMFLNKLKPKTTVELFDFNGSIGSYTLVAPLPTLFWFARGDLSKIFTS